MLKRRRPTMESSIRTLRGFGFDVDAVVDVGILRGTDYLMSNFPGAFHHLFEPIDAYADQIERNYAGLAHQLNHVALSSERGEAFQIGISRNASGKTTHSFLSDRRLSPGDSFAGGPVTECQVVRKTTLDAHFGPSGVPAQSYLVKIDVDGHEMPIIAGGSNVLRRADIVIVEATVRTLLERLTALAALGFELIDVVDMCYYHDTLSQVDLILASKDLLARQPDLRPWNHKPFSNDAWFVLSPTLNAA